MFICHPAAKIPCQLGGSSMGFNSSLCMPTGWLNLSSLSLNKGKSWWWFEQMFCKLRAGSWCSKGVVWSLNQALSFAPGASCLRSPILCLGRSFSRGQRSQIAKRRDIQGRKSWQLVPGCEQLCFAVRGNSSTALGVAVAEGANGGKAAAKRRRKGWRCLGLELHSVPGQGVWVCSEEWESQPAKLVVVAGMAHSPEEARALQDLLNPKKWQQFSNIIFWVHVVKVVQSLSMNTQIGLGVAEIDQMYWNQLIWECPCKEQGYTNLTSISVPVPALVQCLQTNRDSN